MRAWLLAVLSGLALLVLNGSAPPPSLPQDAYVWQRHWTPALHGALRQSRELVAHWRVLFSEMEKSGHEFEASVDRQALAATRRPVIEVFRIDGLFPLPKSHSGVGEPEGAWEQSHNVSGVEFDYDCATAKLPSYVRFLGGIRWHMGIAHLSITVLPAWMDSPVLPELLRRVDESVLQVHAVRDPHQALFDPVAARAWIDRYAAITPGPFRVALPDYGARAVWADDGRLVAVESEVPRLAGGEHATELMAMPRDVAALLEDLRLYPPPHFAGVVWFRLPTADDSLAWSPETWSAVVRGDNLNDRIDVTRRTDPGQGFDDIVLANRGSVDGPLPAAIELPSSCTIADGANGYERADDGERIALRRMQSGLLRAGHDRTIGWMRCAHVGGDFNVRP